MIQSFASSLRSFIAYRLGAARWVYYGKGRRLKRILGSRYTGSAERLGDCIIAVNDAVCQNGGLCDSLHGIVSAYCVARQQGRRFQISYVSPFLLTDYLVPNQCDWRIMSDAIDYRACRVRYVPMMQWRFRATWQEERDYQLRYLTHLAAQRGTTLLYTNAHLFGWGDFSSAFSELFRPSAILQQQIDYHLSQIGGDYIGASFRFRNLLGDTIEPGSTPLSSHDQDELIARCRSQIEALHLSHPTVRILVTSDSSTFCRSLQVLPYVYCVQGMRGHVVYQEGADTVMNSFVDLFLLSRSQGNTLFITDCLYHSSFAMTASFIGNVPYQEIRF